MKKLFFALLLITNALFAGEMLYEDDIEALEAHKLQKKGALLIDVRDPMEFLFTGHAVGSVNVPIFFLRVSPKDIATRNKLSLVELKKGKAYHPKKYYDIAFDENKDFVKNVNKMTKGNKETVIILGCRSGERSEFAGNILAKNGYDKVYNLEDGFMFGWKKENLPFAGE